MFLPLFIALTGIALIEAIPSRTIREQLPEPLLREIERLETDYHLKLIIDGKDFIKKTEHYTLQANGVTLEAVLRDMPIFLEEWRRYPPSFIRKVGIQQLQFCHNMNIAYTNYYIAGTIASTAETIYYSLQSDLRRTPSSYREYHLISMIHLIHHELFHSIDIRLSSNAKSDSDWQQLNAKNFTYYRSFSGTPTLLRVTNLIPGFITLYGQASMAEDKAEVFSYMMTNLHEMELRALDNTQLQQKMQCLKDKLKVYAPEIDDCFWTTIRHLPRQRLTEPGWEDPWALAHPVLPPVACSQVCEQRQTNRRLLLKLPRILPSRHRYR